MNDVEKSEKRSAARRLWMIIANFLALPIAVAILLISIISLLFPSGLSPSLLRVNGVFEILEPVALEPPPQLTPLEPLPPLTSVEFSPAETWLSLNGPNTIGSVIYFASPAFSDVDNDPFPDYSEVVRMSVSPITAQEVANLYYPASDTTRSEAAKMLQEALIHDGSALEITLKYGTSEEAANAMRDWTTQATNLDYHLFAAALLITPTTAITDDSFFAVNPDTLTTADYRDPSTPPQVLFYALHSRLSQMESLIGDNPARAVEVKLMRNDLENIRETTQRNIDSMQTDMDNFKENYNKNFEIVQKSNDRIANLTIGLIGSTLALIITIILATFKPWSSLLGQSKQESTDKKKK